MRLDELGTTGKWVLLSTMCSAVLFLLLATAEGAVRLRAYLKYGYVWESNNYVTDEATGLYIPVPNSKIGEININSAGFRGPDLAQIKPDLRIAFLGASTTYCAEVPNDQDHWPAVVAEMLARDTGLQTDYVNGGVPGYGVKHSLVNLNQRIAAYKPDLLMIYHATNDLSRHTFEQAQNEGLVKERPETERSWITNYSYLAYLVDLNLNIWLQQQSQQTQDVVGTLDPKLDELTSRFRKELETLISKAKTASEIVAIGTFSTHFRDDQSREYQVEAASTSLYYMPYMSIEGLLETFTAYNNVIRELAEAHDLILIEPSEFVPGDGDHFNDSIHFKTAGSRKMGEGVAAALLASPEFQAFVASKPLLVSQSSNITKSHIK